MFSKIKKWLLLSKKIIKIWLKPSSNRAYRSMDWLTSGVYIDLMPQTWKCPLVSFLAGSNHGLIIWRESKKTLFWIDLERKLVRGRRIKELLYLHRWAKTGIKGREISKSIEKWRRITQTLLVARKSKCIWWTMKNTSPRVLSLPV